MVESVYTAVVIAVLSTWLCISVVLQFRPKGIISLKQYDFFALLPRWTFFAPRPEISDYCVLYRDRMWTGELSPWRKS